MEEALQALLTTITDEVGAAAIPDASKQTTLWCLGQLRPLYAKFRQTNESRYGEEISRLVRGAVKDMTAGTKPGVQVKDLAASISDRFRQLHAEFGLPGLNFKPITPSPSRSRKAV